MRAFRSVPSFLLCVQGQILNFGFYLTDANSEEECWTFPQPPLNEEINWLETEGQQLNGTIKFFSFSGLFYYFGCENEGSFLEEENHIEDYPIETNNMATGDPSNDNLWLNDEVEIESQNPEGIQHETMEKIKDLCLSDDLGFNHQQDYETVQEDYDEVDFNPGIFFKNILQGHKIRPEIIISSNW